MEHSYGAEKARRGRGRKRKGHDEVVEMSPPKRRTRASTMAYDYSPLPETSSYGMSHDTPYRRARSSTISERLVTTTSTSVLPSTYATSHVTQPAPEVAVNSMHACKHIDPLYYSQTPSAAYQMATQAASIPMPPQVTQYYSQAPMPAHQTSTLSAMNQRTTSGYPQSRLHQPSTSHHTPEIETSSRYAAPPAHLSGISDMFHAMAERTRAATRKRHNSTYTPQQDIQNKPQYSMPQRPDPSLLNVSSASLLMHIPNLCVSNPSCQSSSVQYIPEAVHHLPITAPPTYWTPKPYAVRNTRYPTRKFKTRYVQTDLSITVDEAKLIKQLQVKQMDVDNVRITVCKRTYTVTYVQPERREISSTSLSSLVRSSDLIKSSLIQLQNSFQRGNNNALTAPTQFQNNPERYFDNDSNSQPIPAIIDLSQNKDSHAAKTDSQILESLLNDKRSDNNHGCRSNTPQACQTNTAEKTFSIPTVSGNRGFSYNNNNRRPHFRPPTQSHSPQPSPLLGRNFSSDFLRYAPFMNPRFLPQAVRQTFHQYGTPGWF